MTVKEKGKTDFRKQSEQAKARKKILVNKKQPGRMVIMNDCDIDNDSNRRNSRILMSQ